jgi:hypothetical protein
VLLYLYPFKFSARPTGAVYNVVADALSRIFEGEFQDTPGTGCVALL